MKSLDLFVLLLQVKMLRYGRQTVSVDVDSGVLLFDRKAVSFGVERISHERSKAKRFSFHISCKYVSC